MGTPKGLSKNALYGNQGFLFSSRQMRRLGMNTQHRKTLLKLAYTSCWGKTFGSAKRLERDLDRFIFEQDGSVKYKTGKKAEGKPYTMTLEQARNTFYHTAFKIAVPKHLQTD